MDLPSLLMVLQQWLSEAIAQYSILYSLSVTFLILALSILLLFKIHRVCLFSKSSNIYNLPPSPPRIPIIGNLYEVGTLPHRSFRILSQKYGPLMLLHLGKSPTLVVSSTEMAKEIMKNQDHVFANRRSTTAATALFYGCIDIGFAPYGEYWRQVRKICVLELLSVKRVQSFRNVREEEVDTIIQKISSSCSSIGEGEVVINLSTLLLTLANNIVSRCALGAKYESVDENKFGQLSRDVFRLLGAFSFGDYFPSLGWLDVVSGLTSKLKKVSQELDAFFDQVIDEHLLRHSVSQEDMNKLDLTDILLISQKDNPNVSRNNIKAIILDMFTGGTDTIATIMEWAMAELIKNPKVMKIAQDEVRRVVGNKCKLEEKDIKQMNYLLCIVKEILRLHPPVTLTPRESSKATQIAGYDIPPRTVVYINVWAIHRDAKLWDDPEEFRPERFINNPIDFMGQEFEFIPFGSGRRGCPGISFGITVVEFNLANLLYYFNWELPAGDKRTDLDMTEVFGLTVHKKMPLNIVPRIYASPPLDNGTN